MTRTLEIEEQIAQFIAQNILFSDNGFPFAHDASFLQESVIDSLGVMELVTFVGKTYGINVEPSEVTPEHFDSVARLAAYVRHKAGPPAPSVNTGS